MERSHNAFIYVGILQIFGRSGTFELVVVCFDATIEQFPLPIGFSAKERFKVFHGSDKVSGPSGVFFHDAAQSTVHVFHFPVVGFDQLPLIGRDLFIHLFGKKEHSSVHLLRYGR